MRFKIILHRFQRVALAYREVKTQKGSRVDTSLSGHRVVRVLDKLKTCPWRS